MGIHGGVEQAVTPHGGEEAVTRLDEIPGVGCLNVAEVGLDRTRFPTPAQQVSWAGSPPGASESAGRKKTAALVMGTDTLPGWRAAVAAGRTKIPSASGTGGSPASVARKGAIAGRKVHPGDNPGAAQQPRRSGLSTLTRLLRIRVNRIRSTKNHVRVLQPWVTTSSWNQPTEAKPRLTGTSAQRPARGPRHRGTLIFGFVGSLPASAPTLWNYEEFAARQVPGP